MRHVFGLSVPHFFWNKDVPESLRLDYLVLLNTANELSYTGDVVKFYLAVMNNNIPNVFMDLSTKYSDKGELDMTFVSPDFTDFKAKMGMLGNLANEVGGRFVISEEKAENNRPLMNKFAKAVGRRCLLRMIKRNETTIHEMKEKYLHPSGLDWEYYGIES